MMKKLISIILSICMLLSLVVLPVNVFATESEEATYEGDTYYKFTFGENGTAYQQAYDSDDTLTYKGNTYNPIVTAHTDLSASASVKTITDENTGESFGVLDIEHSEKHGQQIWVTLLKEDGTPFELEPNSSYTIKYEIYSSRLADYAQGFFVGGSHNSRLSNHSSLYTQYGTVNGTAQDLKAITTPVQTNSALYDTAIRYNANGAYTSANGKLYVNATQKLVTLDNGSYNSATGSLSFEHPTFTLQSVKPATQPDDWGTATYYSGATWKLQKVANDAEFVANTQYYKSIETGNTVTLNNYLAFSFSSNVFEADTNGDGLVETLTDDFCIKSVEIYKDGEVAEVTFTYANGTTSKVDVNKGKAIEYPELIAEKSGKYVVNQYDAVWSLSDTEYIPVPEVSDGTALTVYELRRYDKQSFESYDQDYEYVNNKWLTNAMVTDEEAYEGSKSMKYENTNLIVLTSAPTDWETAWTNYYSYNEQTDTFSKLSGEAAPAFENGKYYKETHSGEMAEQGMFIVKGLGGHKNEGYTYSYKITFKYYVPKDMAYEVNITTKQITTGNIWASGMKDLSGTFVIPKKATDGWQTGALYVSANELVASTYGGQVIVFIARTATITYANARNCVVYFDDVVCEDYTPTPTVIYHHNDGVTEDKVITEAEGIVPGSNDIDYVPETAPEGKYFMGWYTDEALTTSAGTTFTVPPSGIQETDLYAKWGNYADGDIFNFEGITDKAATGYAYMKDGVYSRVDGINETGWAFKDFTADGVVLGKKDAGNAFKWDPTLEETGGDHVQTKSASDLVAVAEASSEDVGEQYTVGWGTFSNYIVKDANGNAVIAKPNTKYAVLMTYEVLASGPVTLHIGMGRKDAYWATGADSNNESVYNSHASTNSFTIGTDKLTGETDTFTYYIDTGDFTGVAPVVSIHCKASGYLGERLADDGNGCASYQVNGVTYYPHRIVSVPRVAIKEIALIEIENENPVVTYKYYEEGEGFSAVIKDAPVGSAIDVPTNNVDPNWYEATDAAHRSNVTTYPSTNTVLYNADYMMAHVNEAIGRYTPSSYFGSRGMSSQPVTKDGKTVYALNYNPYGYDECLDVTGCEYGFKDDVTDVEATKVARMNDTLGKATNVYRLGTVTDGNTYKITMSFMAKEMGTDIGIKFATAQNVNVWGGKSNAASYTISKANTTADGATWYDLTYYVTADLGGTPTFVDGIDDNIPTSFNELFFYLTQSVTNSTLEGEDNDVYFADIKVEDLGAAVGKNGASVLNDVAMQTATSQAMRFYFTYETEDGTTIKLGNEEFEVVERGFIYQNGAIGKYTAANGAYTGLLLDTSGIKKSAKTEGFENCWAYENGTMTFSTYVKGFTKDLYDSKLIVRGYVTFADADGKLHTVYSDTVNRSVNGVITAGNYHPAK